MDIKPRFDFFPTYKSGSLPDWLPHESISAQLGFEPETDPDDDGKVTMQWDFTVDGFPCSIWDYKGVRWSTFGPEKAFRALFNSYEHGCYARTAA